MLIDNEYLVAADLLERDHDVTIEKITQGMFPDFENPKLKVRKPILWFKGKKKGFGFGAKVGKSIAKLLGTNDTDRWIGKTITIYPTLDTAYGQEVECIRVRPRLPKSDGKQTAARGDDLAADVKREIERQEAAAGLGDRDE